MIQMTISQLELRIASLEQKLTQLADKVDSSPSGINAWIDQIHGTFQNDAAYRQAARLGREWRKSQRGPTALRTKKPAAK